MKKRSYLMRKIKKTPQTAKKPLMIICVSGGCLSGVYDETGEEYTRAVVVDFDNQEDCHCPVCGSEGLIINDDGEDQPCSECGYDSSGDNAIQCAIAYAKGQTS